MPPKSKIQVLREEAKRFAEVNALQVVAAEVERLFDKSMATIKRQYPGFPESRDFQYREVQQLVRRNPELLDDYYRLDTLVSSSVFEDLKRALRPEKQGHVFYFCKMMCYE